MRRALCIWQRKESLRRTSPTETRGGRVKKNAHLRGLLLARRRDVHAAAWSVLHLGLPHAGLVAKVGMAVLLGLELLAWLLLRLLLLAELTLLRLLLWWLLLLLLRLLEHVGIIEGGDHGGVLGETIGHYPKRFRETIGDERGELARRILGMVVGGKGSEGCG